MPKIEPTEKRPKMSAVSAEPSAVEPDMLVPAMSAMRSSTTGLSRTVKSPRKMMARVK